MCSSVYKYLSIKSIEMASDDNASGDLFDLLAITVGNTEETRNYNFSDHLQSYIGMCLKYLLLVGVFTLNFLGLSVALNCNVNEEMGKRVLSAIFAFFFGFVYLLVNYYTFRVLIRGKVCPMNREKLFPFQL
jgi:hypothetical protein